MSDIVTVDPCSHPELISEPEWPPSAGMSYRCGKCGKKIIIPHLTFAEYRTEDIADIIGLAFGPIWAQKLKEQNR